MAVTLTSTGVPAPQVYSGLKTLASAAVSASAGLYTAQEIAAGDTTTVPADLNRNAMQLDLMGRYSGGWMAIAHGLALSAGTGLTLNISAGHAIVDGIVEFAATTAVMNANTTNHVWAKRDGTIEVKNNVLTAPTVPGVYLGAVVTGASTITSVDEAGRCVLRNGQMYRETGDEGFPADTPSASMSFVAVTQGGRWLWDGEQYLMLTNAVPLDQTSIQSAQSLVVPSGFKRRVFGDFDVTGDLIVIGDFEVSE